MIYKKEDSNTLRYRLVVRIVGFHPIGRGSIPRIGKQYKHNTKYIAQLAQLDRAQDF